MEIPHRVLIEPFNWLTILVEESIDRQTFVRIMCRHVVGHHAARNAQTPGHRARDTREGPTLPILDWPTSFVEFLQDRLAAMPISGRHATAKVFAPVALDNALVVDAVDDGGYMTTHLDGIITNIKLN